VISTCCLSSAYYYTNKGLAFSKEHLLEKEIMDSYYALFFAYQQFGEYKKALEYRLIYDSLYIKTFNPEYAQSAEQTRMQYAQ
jgi:hypothetical protein